MHRFLNTVLGGYVRSVNSYSAGASNVILPHIMGSLDAVSRHGVTWDQIAAHSEVVVAFGGMALKNSAIAAGGDQSSCRSRCDAGRPANAAPASC